MKVDLNKLASYIDQEFTGEAHLTSDEMRSIIAELRASRQQVAKICDWLRGWGLHDEIIHGVETGKYLG